MTIDPCTSCSSSPSAAQPKSSQPSRVVAPQVQAGEEPVASLETKFENDPKLKDLFVRLDSRLQSLEEEQVKAIEGARQHLAAVFDEFVSEKREAQKAVEKVQIETTHRDNNASPVSPFGRYAWKSTFPFDASKHFDHSVLPPLVNHVEAQTSKHPIVSSANAAAVHAPPRIFPHQYYTDARKAGREACNRFVAKATDPWLMIDVNATRSRQGQEDVVPASTATSATEIPLSAALPSFPRSDPPFVVSPSSSTVPSTLIKVRLPSPTLASSFDLTADIDVKPTTAPSDSNEPAPRPVGGFLEDSEDTSEEEEEEEAKDSSSDEEDTVTKACTSVINRDLSFGDSSSDEDEDEEEEDSSSEEDTFEEEEEAEEEGENLDPYVAKLEIALLKAKLRLAKLELDRSKREVYIPSATPSCPPNAVIARAKTKAKAKKDEVLSTKQVSPVKKVATPAVEKVKVSYLESIE